MQDTGYNVAVLGAGSLGAELLAMLNESTLPLSGVEVISAGDAERLEAFDLIFGAVPPAVLVARAEEISGARPLILNAASVDAANAGQVIDPDDVTSWEHVGQRGGPIVLSLPRWAATQLVRLLRPLAEVRQLSRVRAVSTDASSNTLEDESLVPAQVQLMLAQSIALGYEQAPVSAADVMQLTADIHTDAGLLHLTLADLLRSAPGVQVLLDLDGASDEVCERARTTGMLMVTRALESPDILGAVQVHWTVAGPARGAALQAVRLAERLDRAGCIS